MTSGGRHDWFRRFGDIPGVAWSAPPGLDRSHLRGHDATPETWNHSDDLYWPIVYPLDGDEEMTEGSTGSSPALQYPMPDGPRTVAEQLHHLAAALELPGRPADYHHLLSEAANYLYGIRLREPAALREAERLSLLALDLLRRRPEILARNLAYHDDLPVWVSVVRLLHRLYVENGELEQAEGVAVMGQQEFGQRVDRELTQTRERLAALRAEDA